MANEIDLFDDLEVLEGHLAHFEKAGNKKACRRVREDIKILSDQIKREYPDLVLDGDDEVVCTCGEGTGDCDKHEFVEML